MIEGMLLGLLGSVLGIVTSVILAYVINHGGITWTPPGRVDAVPLTVRLWGEPAPMIAVAIALTSGRGGVVVDSVATGRADQHRFGPAPRLSHENLRQAIPARL